MEKIICRLAKCRETRTRDLNLVKCIKNGEVNFLVTEEDIRKDGRVNSMCYVIKDRNLYFTLISYTLEIRTKVVSFIVEFSGAWVKKKRWRGQIMTQQLNGIIYMLRYGRAYERKALVGSQSCLTVLWGLRECSMGGE